MRTFRIALVLIAAPAAASPLPDAPPGGGAPELQPGSVYRRELDHLDREVLELRSKVTTSLGRLKQIESDVLHHPLGGNLTRVVERNELSSIYRMVRLEAQLDGRSLAERADERGLLAPGGEITLFHGPLAPRAHTLSVKLVYRGDSALFPYVEGYRITVAASHDFVPDDRGPTELEVVAREQGNPLTTAMEKRPAIEFRHLAPSAAESAANPGSKGPRSP